MSILIRMLATLLALSNYPGLSYSAESDDCNDYGGDHVAQLQCISKRIDGLDAELNRVYQNALANMPDKDDQDRRKEREQLRKSQRAWLKFKSEDCSLVGGLQGGSNLWVTHFAAVCEEREIKERIKFLKEIADGSTKH